mgnify:CR=1 FL=1
MNRLLRSAAAALFFGCLAVFLLRGREDIPPVILSIPAPQGDEARNAPPPPRESCISVPFTITEEEAAGVVNASLENPLYDVKGQKISDSWGEAAVDMLVEKTSPAQVSLKNGLATFSLPFRFEGMVSWKGKIMGIPAGTRQETSGSGVLRLSALPELDRDWMIRLRGSLSLEWSRKPALRILGQDVGLAKMLSTLLEEHAQDLLRRAEEEINRSARIPEHAREHWSRLQIPSRLNEMPELWLAVVPLDAFMAPVTADDGILSATLGLKCLISVTTEAPSPYRDSPLPPLSRLSPGTEPGFVINLNGTLSYGAMAAYAEGREKPEFEIPGGGRVKLEKMTFRGIGGHLAVEADIRGRSPIAGGVEGSVFLVGKPVFSKEEQILRVEDVDFDANSAQVLTKTASWLARPFLAGKIRERLVFPLAGLREKAIASLRDSLKGRRISPELVLEGDVASLSMESLRLEEKGIGLSFTLTGAASFKYQEEKGQKR